MAATEFEQQVQDALAHLYDSVYLRRHPLAQAGDARTLIPEDWLRQHLLGAIDAVQPGAHVPRASRAWRSYDLMRLRYAEARTAVEVQGLLSLSKSQYYVEHERALQAIVGELKHHGLEGVAVAERTVVGGAPNPRHRINNLPNQVTSLVGREQLLAELQTALAHTRVLTLTGSAGVGKTRLAVELAAAIAGEFDGDLVFVELGPVADDTLVVQTVAWALGIREQAARPLIDTVCDALGRERVLLIFDNCEHVLTACSSFVERLVRGCASASVLATSREPLRVDGETTWRVPSLDVPESHVTPIISDLSVYSACRLFLDRARAVLPSLSITHRDTQAIFDICRRLDGVPLAIELAAARVRMFTVPQICEHLNRAFDLLNTGRRSAPPRQQTLKATLDWSYGLLTNQEKLFLDRLSTFAGGWSFEAAETICAGDGIEKREVLDLLGRLVDKSLVLAEHNEDGTTRYRLLEIVRQYAHKQLREQDGVNQTAQRHAAYFLNLAGSEARVLSPERKAWLDLFEQELDNFRAALHWFVSQRDGVRAQTLAAGLYRLWMYRGYASEGRLRLAESLTVSRGSRATRARACFCLGGVAFIQADYAAAQRDLSDSLSLWREIGDKTGMAWSLMGLGATATCRADFETASAVLEHARKASRESGDAAALSLSLAWSADRAYFDGEFDAVDAFAEEALDVANQTGFLTPACMALSILGNLRYRQGDRTAALEHLQIALEKAEVIGEAYPIVRAALGLAMIAADGGDHQNARSLLARCIQLADRVGNRHHLAQTLEGVCGFVAAEHIEDGERLAQAASAIRAAIGAPLSPTERRVLEAHVGSGQTLVSEIRNDQRPLRLDEAVKLALEICARAPTPQPAATAIATEN